MTPPPARPGAHAGRVALALAAALGVTASACKKKDAGALTIGVAFETLQTEYWVASFEVMKQELKRRNIRMLEAIADGDANKQLEQVQNFIARKVDGIIVAPKDAQTVIPMIKAANAARIPIVLYNRPPAASDARSVTVGVDNFGITKATVEHMCKLAKASGKKHKGLILIGDLGDMNAVGRRDGFEEAAKACADAVEVVSRVPTEWNQEKAMAGVTNALQAHPDISFIFSSSDFMLPSVVSALKTAGKYKKAGEDGHVILGSFDGDATAFQLLQDGYLDADGVQDAFYQSEAAVQAILDVRGGKSVPPMMLDKGLVIHRENMKDAQARMWGAQVKAKGGV
jgi:inositol transport system substrate-binding protein